MPDFALAAEIGEVALRAATKSGGGRVRCVYVTLGRGGHIDPSILADAFTMAVSGTAAEGAVLDITRPPEADQGKLTVIAVDIEEAGD